MRIFKINPFGDTVDLDDPNTYKHLPQNVDDLRNLMFQEIGYFYCYTQFWHKDVFEFYDYGQVKRCENLIKDFTENERENYDNVLWYQEKLYLFKDEIENMC